MLEQAFDVATEFKFDVGQALLSTDALQSQVDQLSQSAQGAMTSLGYLASGLVAHLGFGSGGILGVLTKAVQSAESFNDGSLGFVNNISLNFSHLQGNIATFNDKLTTSQMLMSQIQDTAIRIGVDTDELAGMTHLIATPLAASFKLGNNYENAISMSRNLALGGSTVGLSPRMATENLYRALTERQPIHGALFTRMVNTPAFHDARIKTQQQLVGMQQDRKIDLLAKALSQLAGDAQQLDYRMQSLRVQFIVFKDLVSVILRPIGEAILRPLKMIIHTATDYLQKYGRTIGNSVGDLITNIFGDPEKLYVNLMQLRSFGADFKKAIKFTSALFTVAGIAGLIGPLKPLGAMLETFLGIKGGMGFISIIKGEGGVITKFFMLLRTAFADFLPVAAAFLFFFQVISRAKALAQIHNAKVIANLTPGFLEQLPRLKQGLDNLLLPITMAIDGLAHLVMVVYTSTWFWQGLLDVMTAFTTVIHWWGTGFNILLGVLNSFTSLIFGFIKDLIQLQNPFKDMNENFMSGWKDWVTQHPFTNGHDNAVQNNVTNIGKVEIRNDFKEQLQPDRIAFALVDQLRKVATNPRGGRSNSLQTGFVNGNAFSGARS